MKHKTIQLLFRILVLFEVIWGAHAWFTWRITDSRLMHYCVLFIAFTISYVYKNKAKIKLNTSPYCFIAFFLYVIAILITNRFSIASIPGILLKLFPIWVLISDRNNAKLTIDFLSKGIACILIPGLILYIVLIWIPLPSMIIEKGNVDNYIFYNYIFLLRPMIGIDYASIRFQSIFLEPGYLGAMVSFLLFSSRYDFRNKYNRILLLALLLSFSLAGYIITLVGYLLHLLIERKSLKYLLAIVTVVFITYGISIRYNAGDNYLNQAIFERLKLDEDKGIAGNNRTGEGTDFYFEQVLQDGRIFYGLGAAKVNQINAGSASSAGYDTNIRGAGYKVFIVTYGIIAAVLFMLFYYFLAKAACKRNQRAIYGYMFLIIITFLQAAYPESTSWIYPFTLGMLNYSRN